MAITKDVEGAGALAARALVEQWRKDVAVLEGGSEYSQSEADGIRRCAAELAALLAPAGAPIERLHAQHANLERLFLATSARCDVAEAEVLRFRAQGGVIETVQNDEWTAGTRVLWLDNTLAIVVGVAPRGRSAVVIVPLDGECAGQMVAALGSELQPDMTYIKLSSPPI